jgi:DNA-directed RNA polymerase beta subunit
MQKGTCGLILSQEDMPFTQDGIVPDLVLNPQAIPSRMTINVLLETLLGKACLMEGEFGDATPFTSNSVNIAEKICDRLEKTGFNKYGWETLYSGFTGEPIEAKIYMGCNGRSNAKTLLVYIIHIGNTFKLREHLVMSLILT